MYTAHLHTLHRVHTMKKRLSIMISQDTYNAIEQFSVSVGQTKSETIDQLMTAAIPSLLGMARYNFAARSMTQAELDNLKANLEKVGDFATTASDKATSAVVSIFKGV